MRKAVVILFIFGVGFLLAGSALAIPSVRSRLPFVTITNTGRIASPDDSSSQEAPSPQPANLDIIGYFTILASIGFFATGLVVMRKRD